MRSALGPDRAAAEPPPRSAGAGNRSGSERTSRWISLAACPNRSADACHGDERSSSAANGSLLPFAMASTNPRSTANTAPRQSRDVQLPHQSPEARTVRSGPRLHGPNPDVVHAKRRGPRFLRSSSVIGNSPAQGQQCVTQSLDPPKVSRPEHLLKQHPMIGIWLAIRSVATVLNHPQCARSASHRPFAGRVLDRRYCDPSAKLWIRRAWYRAHRKRADLQFSQISRRVREVSRAL